MTKRTASQIGRMSRRKGKSFECKMARYFTKWTGEKWESTRNSGRTDLKGDIYCVGKPNLRFDVECKDDKKYTTHAMTVPTKAWKDLIKKYIFINRRPTMLLVNNDAGIWFYNTLYNFPIKASAVVVKTCNLNFVKLYDLEGTINFDGIIFNADRMESVGEKCDRKR